MHSVLRQLTAAGHSAELVSFSALDRYFGLSTAPFILVRTDADLADLAKTFDTLRFPGVGVADAAAGGLVGADGTVPAYFFSRDESSGGGRETFDILRFSWNAGDGRFRDPTDAYPLLRVLWKDAAAPWPEGLDPNADRYTAGMDAALVLSRYGRSCGAGGGEDYSAGPSKDLVRSLSRLDRGYPPEPERQQQLLAYLLCSPRPDLGLSLLKDIGFVDEFWPELSAMDGVDHSKEFHPEGNVWTHTMETFRYRKKEELLLSLGLLLHDVGKPLSEASSARRFDRHAELGADAAGKFLRRLGFADTLTEQVRYLVRNHMMPAALPRLPLNRTQDTLESPLFPTLLELYRCDESSSFKGPEGYYESAAAYRTYLRNVKNPYRSADGKKLVR